MVAYTFYEADNRVRRYAEALVKRGDQVDAIVLRREGQSPFDIIRGVGVYRIQKRLIDERGPFSYLRKLLMFFLRSMWLLSLRTLKTRYDIIHVHSVPDFQVFSTLIPRLMGSRVILDIHDIVPEFYASKFKVKESSLTFRILLVIEKLSIAYSDHVIISNHLWRDKLIQRSVRSKKCTAIINYPDTSIFFCRPRTPATNGNVVLCYPGTLNGHQGVDLAIAAVALLREKVRNIRFLIIGDGPDREKLNTMVKEQKLEDYVSISGFVPLEEVAETMADVDLGVVPKRRDSFGNEAFSTKIMEFMAMGVPVLASKTRIDQYYFNDRLVQFFESENVCDLAARILQLIEDPLRCDSLRASAAKFIEHNNWDVRKGEYLDLVNSLVLDGTEYTNTTGQVATLQPKCTDEHCGLSAGDSNAIVSKSRNSRGVNVRDEGPK
jgi:glycosyltransferase involved in cell wall biosynthesis